MKSVTKRAVNEQLAHWLTPKGQRLWWARAHPWLGCTPLEAWKAGDRQAVFDQAEGGRSMNLT